MKHFYKLLVMTILVTLSTYVNAQNSSITGVIVDENDLPLIGATVRVSNHQYLGSLTDASGKFILVNVPEGTQELEIRITSYNVCYTKLLRIREGNSYVNQKKGVLNNKIMESIDFKEEILLGIPWINEYIDPIVFENKIKNKAC